MHIVALRRDVYEENRWIAQSLAKAFIAAQKDAYDEIRSTAALKSMLPWLTHYVEETEELMGRDFWPYGYEANVDALSTFLRYHHEQGLSKRLLTPKELFAPESLESFKI
jgi:4,5-dihydroxyphthalate decarboxylase